jgi:hypothetical protein
LTNEEVGNYLDEHFVSCYQKVGTFRLVNGQKQGGNVASYFCLSDGSVLHAVAGPVDAATLLCEARWVIDSRKLAMTESNGDYDRYLDFFRKAHADRLRHEHRVKIDTTALAAQMGENMDKDPRQLLRRIRKGASAQAQVHLLLAVRPLANITEVYPVVFEKILGERISTLPVQVN